MNNIFKVFRLASIHCAPYVWFPLLLHLEPIMQVDHNLRSFLLCLQYSGFHLDCLQMPRLLSTKGPIKDYESFYIFHPRPTFDKQKLSISLVLQHPPLKGFIQEIRYLPEALCDGKWAQHGLTISFKDMNWHRLLLSPHVQSSPKNFI